MASAPVIYSPPADPLEVEALEEIALLSEAVDYLTRELRTWAAWWPPDRARAVADERNSIEWDAWRLECALGEYRAYLDEGTLVLGPRT